MRRLIFLAIIPYCVRCEHGRLWHWWMRRAPVKWNDGPDPSWDRHEMWRKAQP